MNANQLADVLDYINNGEESLTMASTMLREQAKRIEDLEKQWYMVNKDGYVKPLSDEEIEKVFDNTFKVRDFEEAFLKFARAIEERHGIK